MRGQPHGRLRLAGKREMLVARPMEAMTCKRALLGFVLVGLSSLAQAQDYYPHHNFTFSAGAARPKGDLSPYLEVAPAVGVGYGYRFLRYFQADAGVDINFGAARVRDFLSTQVGDLRIKDREYFVQFGGRGIAPLFHGRVLFSAGGGGAYMRYAERISQPSSYFRVGCPVCTARSGWGYYAVADTTVFLDRAQHFRIGPAAKFFRGHTTGEPLGNLPGVRTKDHWINLYAELGFSF